MVSNGNDPTVFVTRPVSAVILGLSALMVLWPIWKARRAGARVVEPRAGS
jgi:TctA family transporter